MPYIARRSLCLFHGFVKNEQILSMTIRKLLILISFLTVFFDRCTFAQENFELSDCLTYTLNNSPKIKTEQLNQEKETATLYEKKSEFLPQIDAFVNYHHYFNDLPTYIFPPSEGSNLTGMPLSGPYPLQLGLPHNLNTGFELNQTLFDMSFFGNKSLNEHYQSYQDIKLSMAEEEALYQVAILFYQIAVNEEKLKFLDMNLERLSKLQSIVKLQVDQSFASQTDLDKLLVKTANLKSNRKKLGNGIRQQYRYLKLMMGMSQEDEIAIVYDEEESFKAELISLDSETLLEEKMLKEQRELNKLNARRINADYYPRLQAYAAFLFQAQRERFNFLESNQDWYNIHQWGVKLSIPIMRGFEKKNKKEVSEIVDAQLVFGIEQKQEQSRLDFQNAIDELEASREEQESQETNVALAERVYKQSELSYEQGTMLLMDFLDSEATLRESKMMYATALLDTRMAELKILKTSGRLKELLN